MSSEVVSDKLLATHRARAVNERTDKIFASLRTWRREIVEAMATRLNEIDDATTHDELMLTLTREMRLWNFVSAAAHADPECLGVVHVTNDSSPW